MTARILPPPRGPSPVQLHRGDFAPVRSIRVTPAAAAHRDAAPFEAGGHAVYPPPDAPVSG